jgi:uncharacterized protein
VAGISVGATTAITALSTSKGWTLQSPAWGALAVVAMWAPALGRFVAQRTVDRDFRATLPLHRWGATGAQVVLWPVVLPLAVYGAAYAIAWNVGFAQWSPGGGRWTTSSQIVLNLIVNLTILGIFGTFTALGEEIAWRGYLQPRLDAAGVRNSVLLVSLAWTAFHTPISVGMGYVDIGNLWKSIGLSAAFDLSLAFIWAHESYRARSLWPAVFFHSFHNTISQWLFPKFFMGSGNDAWLGEGGHLALAGYIVGAIAVYLWMRRRAQSWHELARSALETVTEESSRERITSHRFTTGC